MKTQSMSLALFFVGVISLGFVMLMETHITNAEFPSAPSVETTQVIETIFLDTRISQNPVIGTSTLEMGKSYVLQESGTFSNWYSSTWSSYCGQPENSPTIPSPGTQNGKVGVDAAYVFAAPSGYFPCGSQVLPWKNNFVEVSLDGGVSWYKPSPMISNYQPSHTYEYAVIGRGLPARFRYVDSPNSDNYGILTINILTANSISGRVTNDTGIGASGIIISSSLGISATTDASGYYTITSAITGAFTITPTKSGYIFAPITRTVSVPPNATEKDFKIRPQPLPFLDLPISYSNFSQSARGKVNSWFDHTFPNYGTNADLTIWLGNRYPGASYTSKYTCDTGVSCYDGHNGIDFQKQVNDESILAAATGTVTNTVRGCSSGVFCAGGYGNQVWIDHHNGFATRYAHLKSISVTNEINITNIPAQPLGIMGNTGGTSIGKSGVHLHFGLYYDKNGNGQWAEDEVVDPYGWFGTGADSWSTPGGYLWKYPLNAQQSAGTVGTNITSPSGNVNTVVPSGALTTTVTLQLWDSPPVAAPSAQLRSSGGSFWLRVLEWLTGGGNSPTTRTTASSFAQPVTVSVTYGVTETQHLDVNQLTMYRWDEVSSTWVALPTTVDTNLRQATAQTTEIGSFDLQAPLLCPADTQEIDDNFYAAKSVSTNGSQASRLFDIAQDEDWLKFDAVGGTRYVVQTSNLASGVDTIVQVYDLDGVTVLASDDNSGGGKASRLSWQAQMSGTYFTRVSRAAGGAYGCSTTYQLSVAEQIFPIFLPFIRK